MKDELICVEYSLNRVVTKKPKVTPLLGAVGETSKRLLVSALKRISFAEKTGQEKDKDLLVPVRFPLIAPNSCVSIYNSDRDPCDIYKLKEEGISLSPYDLHPLRAVPISYYQRCKLSSIEQLFNLVKEKRYHYTNSRDIFLFAIDKLSEKFPNIYSWYQGWEANSKHHDLFYEARFYGLNTVISTYDANNFGGVAVEIIVRTWAPAEARKEVGGTVATRKKSDVVLFSSTNKYIEEADGVSFGRLPLLVNQISTRYSRLMTPSYALKAKSKPEDYRSPPLYNSTKALKLITSSATAETTKKRG